MLTFDYEVEDHKSFPHFPYFRNKLIFNKFGAKNVARCAGECCEKLPFLIEKLFMSGQSCVLFRTISFK